MRRRLLDHRLKLQLHNWVRVERDIGQVLFKVNGDRGIVKLINNKTHPHHKRYVKRRSTTTDREEK